MHIISISTIPGVMVGIEWDYINGFVCIDLFFIRFVWDYAGEPDEGESQ